MTPRDEDRDPSPEQLAAYLDGEHDYLAGLTPERMECWLKSHPEAAAQARAQRRLARLWRAATPDDPSPAAWRHVLTNIERGLDHEDLRKPPRRPWWGVGLGLLATAATAAVIALAMNQRPPAANVPSPAPAPEVTLVEAGPLAVAGDGEVEILSVSGADVPSLVVGILPLQGIMVLASPGEVNLIRSGPSEDRAMPDVRMNGEETPMVCAAAAPEPKNNPIQP